MKKQMSIRQQSTPTPLSQISQLQLISCTPDCTSNNYNSIKKLNTLSRYCKKVAPCEKFTRILFINFQRQIVHVHEIKFTTETCRRNFARCQSVCPSHAGTVSKRLNI